MVNVIPFTIDSNGISRTAPKKSQRSNELALTHDGSVCMPFLWIHIYHQQKHQFWIRINLPYMEPSWMRYGSLFGARFPAASAGMAESGTIGIIFAASRKNTAAWYKLNVDV